MSGAKASIDETGCSVVVADRDREQPPRRSMTRWSPCTLTMPPSSTPACWTFVTDSSLSSFEKPLRCPPSSRGARIRSVAFCFSAWRTPSRLRLSASCWKKSFRSFSDPNAFSVLAGLVRAAVSIGIPGTSTPVKLLEKRSRRRDRHQTTIRLTSFPHSISLV